jgi:hypothetical protein
MTRIAKPWAVPHLQAPTAHFVSTAATLVAITIGTALPASADDGQQGRTTRLAAVGDQASAPLSRLGVPPRPAQLDLDLRVLLADRTPGIKQLDVAPADDTILVAFARDIPQTVEQDIAQEYGLELVERTELEELDLRIVQYRSINNKPVSTILSELRHDQRVRKAQRNVMHTLPGSSPPPVASANEKTAPPPPQATARREADPKTPARSSAQQQPPMRVLPKQVDKPVVAAAQAGAPARAGGVGDVLAGGL